jgi:hypothetical protein
LAFSAIFSLQVSEQVAHGYQSQYASAFFAWIEEALMLASSGMPANSFNLVIEGATWESLEVWNALKFAAATQEARLRQCRFSRTLPMLRPLQPDYRASWSLPIGFAKTIREIVECNSTVQFDRDVGELWNEEAFYSERKN